MQSGFHLESMGNKFIGFFFLLFFFLAGVGGEWRRHDDIYEVMSSYITSKTGSRGNSETGVHSSRGRQRQNIFNTATMHKLVFCCLIIISFSCPLFSLPTINTSEMSHQLSGKSLLILVLIKQWMEHCNQKRSMYAFRGDLYLC